MKISPLTKLATLGAFAVGTATSAVLIGSAHHSAAPTRIVVRQDAATGSISSSAPIKAIAPARPAAVRPTTATTTSAAVKRPALVQEAPVTDPTASDAGSAPAPAPASTFFQPITEKPGPGNVPSSTSGNSIPTATADPAPSN